MGYSVIIQIDTQKLEDPNVFGETLRDYCFDCPPNQTGCYSCFKLKTQFKEVDRKSALGKWFIRELEQCDPDWSLGNQCSIFSDGNIWIGWFWEGDGDLIIIEGKKIARNTDCKKDYTWEWMK